MLNPDVVAVVVNFNTPSLTVAAVRSILASSLSTVPVIVVDNGSHNGSVAQIRSDLALEERVMFLELKDNLGFAGGFNEGMRIARSKGARYVLIASSDVMLEPTCVERLFNSLEESGAAAAQPVILRPDRETIDSLGHAIGLNGDLHDIGEGAKATLDMAGPPVQVFGVCAACAMYRVADLESLGTFDDSFFIYYEDVDMSFRYRFQGRTMLLVPSALATHVRRATSDGWRFQAYYDLRNLAVVRIRHFPLNRLINFRTAQIIGLGLREAAAVRRLLEFCRMLAMAFVDGNATSQATKTDIFEHWAGNDDLGNPKESQSGAPTHPARWG